MYEVSYQRTDIYSPPTSLVVDHYDDLCEKTRDLEKSLLRFLSWFGNEGVFYHWIWTCTALKLGFDTIR